MTALERPIVLVGAARSGTTIVAEVLAAHPNIAFWNEPRYVWRHGKHAARDDVRTRVEATAPVAQHIRDRFEKFLRKSARPRFMEKTPSNCFRVGFVHEVFPDALFLHLRRDGRDAAASALRRWCSAPDDQAIARRMRGFEIPITALPYYLPDIVREIVFRRLRPARGYLWGPRYPGIHEDLASGRDVAEICARQWVESERAATTELAAIPANQRFTFRYEDFIRDPTARLREILDFSALSFAPEVKTALGQVRRVERTGTAPGATPAQLSKIEAICLPAMIELDVAPREDFAQDTAKAAEAS